MVMGYQLSKAIGSPETLRGLKKHDPSHELNRFNLLNAREILFETRKAALESGVESCIKPTALDTAPS